MPLERVGRLIAEISCTLQDEQSYWVIAHYMLAVANAWRKEGQYTLAISCACRLLGMCAEYRLAFEWGVQLVRGKELDFVHDEDKQHVMVALQKVRKLTITRRARCFCSCTQSTTAAVAGIGRLDPNAYLWLVSICRVLGAMELAPKASGRVPTVGCSRRQHVLWRVLRAVREPPSIYSTTRWQRSALSAAWRLPLSIVREGWWLNGAADS